LAHDPRKVAGLSEKDHAKNARDPEKRSRFSEKIIRKIKNLERDPISMNRIVL
jgi:hypothetical protein